MSTKLTIETFPSALPAKIDLLICSASFEERSVVASLNIPAACVDRAVIFVDPEVTGHLGTQAAETLKGWFQDKGVIVPLRLRDPLDIADKMVRAVGMVDSNAEIVIDITTFTHEAILILIRVLQLANPMGPRFRAIYTGAAEYAVGQKKEEKWLTKGVKDIRSVLGFPGESQPTRSQHLIVLAGFELERAERIIDAYEPTLLSVGLGNPLESISPNHHDVNKWFHGKLMERYSSVEQFMFSCDDPVHTKSEVLAHLGRHPGYNVIIAPLNTKISTIGIGLAALADQNIQICYAVPEQYNRDGYSSPSESIYCFDVSIPPLS
jgi:hypothetical protein